MLPFCNRKGEKSEAGQFSQPIPPSARNKERQMETLAHCWVLGQCARHQISSMKSDIELIHRDHQELRKITVLERIMEGIGKNLP